MKNNKDNITIGLPKPGGAIYFAPLGTTLPTNAKDSLSAEFVNLGYVTEDGVTVADSEETNEINAWGPETVMMAQSSYSQNVTFNLLESCRESTLQFIYGKENVKVNEDGSLRWRTTGKPLPRGVLVVDTLQNNGGDQPRIHREVFGDCQFIDRSGDKVYNNSDAVSYPVSMRAFKFADPEDKTQVYSLDFLTALSTTPAENSKISTEQNNPITTESGQSLARE